MSGYTKLFSSLIASTIWREDNDTRIVWITMLAMADRHGVVEASVPGLADLARVSVEACRGAIVKLSNPDPDSRSQEFEGRRIEPVDGGFRILNHERYRAKLSEDERREYQRRWQAEKRARERAVDSRVDKIEPVDKISTGLTQAEAEAEAEEQDKRESPAAPSPSAAGKTMASRWNGRADAVGLPRCIHLSGKREAHCRKRLSEHPVEYWEQVIARIQASDFCRGVNDRGWVATFDWLIANADNAIKVLEGKYDNRAAPVTVRTSAAPAPEYSDEWACDHDPECPNREWHALKLRTEG